LGWLADVLRSVQETDFGVATSPVRGIASAAQKLLGSDPVERWSAGAGHSSAPPTSVGGDGFTLAGNAIKKAFEGSGTWDWSPQGGPMNGFDLGGVTSDFPLTTTTGRRGLIPYTGGFIPSGYRVGMRPARRPTPGTAGGVYLIPRRTMNPLNPRALMRAERRMNAFSKWVKRHFTIQKAMPKRRKVGGRKRR
jgi:hypothetical protein